MNTTDKEICGVCKGEADENGDCVNCGNECYPTKEEPCEEKGGWEDLDARVFEFFNNNPSPTEIRNFIRSELATAREKGRAEMRKEIKEWALERKEKLTMKWDADKAQSTVYDCILFNNGGFPSPAKLIK